MMSSGLSLAEPDVELLAHDDLGIAAQPAVTSGSFAVGAGHGLESETGCELGLFWRDPKGSEEINAGFSLGIEVFVELTAHAE